MGHDEFSKDYYLILGVGRSASPEGIRAAYREQAKRHHPDRVGEQGSEAFREVAEAYETLSDPMRRHEYNRRLARQESARAWSRLALWNRAPEPEPLIREPISVLDDFATIAPSAEALGDRVRRNFTDRSGPKSERTEGLNIEIVLNPEEAMRGGRVALALPVLAPCPDCGGTGQNWLFPCLTCRGQRAVEGERPVEVTIPPGVRPGSVIELPLDGLGVRNLYLRLHVFIGGAP